MTIRKFLTAIAIAGLTVQGSTPAALSSRLMLPSKSDQSKGVPSRYHTKKTFKHFKQFSVYVPMKDGTQIATEVYLPQPLPDKATLPVMFEQSRYWRVLSLKFPLSSVYSKPLSLFRSQFLSHGYAWVVIDTRGGGASSGARPWEFCPLDVTDSEEVMQWILKQPWSNGKIGVLGHSYSGNLAELSLLSDLPNIKAAAVLSSPFDLYSNDLRPGGMQLEPFISDWCELTQSFDKNKFPDTMKTAGLVLKGIRPVDGDGNKQVLKSILAKRQPMSTAMFDNVCFRDDHVLNEDGSNSPDFARGMSLLKKRYGENFQKLGIEVSSPSGFFRDVDKAKVPIYAVAGWMEGANAEAAIDRFNNYTTAGTKLLLGPWDHNFFNISPFTHGGPTKFDFADELLKFFDYHLKGTGAGIAADKPVNYFTLGEEKWHSAASFPPDTTKQKLFIGDHHTLTSKASDTTGGDEYKNDNSVGTGKETRWDCMTGKVLFNPYSQMKKSDRKRLLYETQPLSAAIKITGSPRCNFYLESDGPDCAVFVYLEDVTPQGKVHYVTEGQLLCGHRATPEAEQDYKDLLPARSFKKADYKPIKPGEIIDVAIGMLPVSYQFQKGHRIRLSVCSADSDHFKLPPSLSVGKSFTIHRGPSANSSIELPTDSN